MESHPDLNCHTTANTDTYFPNCSVGMKAEMWLGFVVFFFVVLIWLTEP